MSKIAQFFKKKKDEAAFKLKLGGSLGQGHSLNSSEKESSTSQKRSVREVYEPPQRKELSNEAKTAAAAALARIEKKDSARFNTSLAAIRAQAKRELEAEATAKSESKSTVVKKETDPTCEGILFRCPIISCEVLPKSDWKIKIKEFLYQQLEFERALTACLIIQNCNTKEKSEACVTTLKKYLENIINHPDEEKFCSIRMSNRIFSEKVRYVEGAMDFLTAAGFRELELDNEPFLVWSKDNLEKDTDLPSLLEALQNAEPLNLELDRNIKVLLPSQAGRVVLPDDFYRISPEEIKREQQLRSEAIESAQILKTKAMREREEQRVLRMYKYALIRVKFPDGLFIQGTFNVYEKICNVFEFVQSCLQDESIDFSLSAASLGNLTEEYMEKSLYDLRLLPNVLLLFNVPANVAGQNYLKDDLLLLVQGMQ